MTHLSLDHIAHQQASNLIPTIHQIQIHVTPGHLKILDVLSPIPSIPLNPNNHSRCQMKALITKIIINRRGGIIGSTRASFHDWKKLSACTDHFPRKTINIWVDRPMEQIESDALLLIEPDQIFEQHKSAHYG